jgi:hypothetical protein
MPKVSSVAICRKRDDGEYDASLQPPKFVKEKFALFLRAYEKCEFDKNKAFEKVGIMPGQFHRWMKKYPDLKRRLEICEEGFKDFAEKRLMEFMKMNNKLGMVTTLFYLKTKCQDRGYVEQVQFNGVVENRYPQEMIDAVSRAAKHVSGKPIAIPSAPKMITNGE